MTTERMVELMEIEHQCMLRASHGDCDGKCQDCDLVQDDGELHEMYTDVIGILKNMIPVVPKADTDWNGYYLVTKYLCGHCSGVLVGEPCFCPFCGRPVKWGYEG